MHLIDHVAYYHHTCFTSCCRQMYPHLTVGTIGLSAVIVAKEDFPEYLDAAYNTITKENQHCVNTLADSH